MGLLDFFKKRIKGEALRKSLKETAGAPEESSVYSGMRVEVTASDGRLLFVAKLMNLRGTAAELHQYFDSALPEDTEPVRVHIRGYNDHQRKVVCMEGVISPLPKRIWQVEDLVIVKQGNDRDFFRLETSIDASITKFSGMCAGERPCKLLDISAGGARIAAGQRYWEGDKLLLNVKLCEDRDNSIIYCQVLRIIEKENEPYEYGCQFLELTEAGEGKITQNLFELQRKARKGSK